MDVERVRGECGVNAYWCWISLNSQASTMDKSGGEKFNPIIVGRYR